MKVRSIKKEDIEALSGVYVRAFPEQATGETWSFEAASSLLTYWLGRQSDLAYLALCDNGKIAGAFFVGIRPWWDGNHLVDGEIFVDPEFQGQGIATLLLEEVLLKAKEKYNPVCFQTYTFRDSDKEKNSPLSWYKRLGFDEIEEWTMIRADFNNLMKNLEQRKK